VAEPSRLSLSYYIAIGVRSTNKTANTI